MATVGLIPEAIHKYPQVSILISTESDGSTDASQPKQDARNGPDLLGHVKESCKWISNPPEPHFQIYAAWQLE